MWTNPDGADTFDPKEIIPAARPPSAFPLRGVNGIPVRALRQDEEVQANGCGRRGLGASDLQRLLWSTRLNLRGEVGSGWRRTAL